MKCGENKGKKQVNFRTHLSIGNATPLIAFAPSPQRNSIAFAISNAVMVGFWLKAATGLRAAEPAESKSELVDWIEDTSVVSTAKSW